MGSYFDKRSGAKVRILAEHAMIHRGKSFYLYTEDTTMDGGDTLAVCFKTGAKEVHFGWGYAFEIEGYLSIHENADWDSGSGTALTIFNNHRQSSLESTIQGDESGSFVADEAVENPDNIDDGDEILQERAWGTQHTGNVRTNKRELVLKPNTKYEMKFTAVTGSQNSNGCSVILNWYELDD